MKTPQDFNINPYGSRSGNGIYSTKWICYYDAERYIEMCRTRFAEDVYHAAPLPPWNGFTQQFLEVAREVFTKEGDEGLIRYFNEFADYVIEKLPSYEKINEWYEEDSRIIAYNDYVCEQSGGKITHKAKHPDYVREVLSWLTNNWNTYWEWCGSDSQRCGGNFRRYYAAAEGNDKWGERYEYFVSTIAKGFNDKINAALNARK